MRLLQLDLSSSYPLARAGGHRTIHSLLLHLAQDPAIDCLSVTTRRGMGSQLPEYDPRLADFEALGIRGVRAEPDRWIFDCGYPVWAVDAVEKVFEEAVETFRPEVVWSNSYISLPLLHRARENGLPAVWYIHDRRGSPDELREAAQSGVEIVSVSPSIRDHIERTSGLDTPVVYPLTKEDDYVVEPDFDGYVTMINPRPVKGYDVFLGIAPLLPDVRFLVVEAWPLGAGLPEVEKELRELSNVSFLRQVADAREIYRQTRLLLVPSVVEEGGPRVVREAQLSGIPVLGSPRGNVPDMIGEGGEVIEDYENPRAWAEAIRSLLANPARFQQLSRNAWKNARRTELTTAVILGEFKAACGRAIDRTRVASPS